VRQEQAKAERNAAAQAYCEEVERRQQAKAAALGKPCPEFLDKTKQHELFAAWRKAGGKA
jgi:hypothetical protein